MTAASTEPATRGSRRADAYLAELRAGRAKPEATGGVLTAATADPSLQLFFWLPSDDSHAPPRGRLVPDLPEEPAGRTPVARGELHLGTVVHDPALRDRGNLLDEVTMRAGLAIEIARLRVEVRRQLAVVEQSRARIVSATLEERRRLERDLHDGAQQQLVSLGLELRHLQQGRTPRPMTPGRGLTPWSRGWPPRSPSCASWPTASDRRPWRRGSAPRCVS